MALEKEIWINDVIEPLVADNSFMTKCVNADEYVKEGKIVHIPNAGVASKVEKNRSVLPATAKKRTDKDLTFTLNEFTTDPSYLPDAEKVELSYDKRKSLLAMDSAELERKVAQDLLKAWYDGADTTIMTSGAGVPAHFKSATGKRKALTKGDVLELMTKFNEQDVPQEGRYLLLDASMYSQLLNSLTANENSAFLASANAQKGILGQLSSFNVMMRSTVMLLGADKNSKEWGSEIQATDLAGGIAWHEKSVCKALGEKKMLGREDDPLYYGDIYAFLVRAGGAVMRSDKAGVARIVQTTTV